MNPLQAVEPVAGARGPLATLQALADALAAMAPQGPGLAEESRAPAGESVANATLGVPAEDVPPVQPAAESSAVHGRFTLGQLATEQAALRATPGQASGTAATEALQSAPALDAGTAAPRLAETVIVPVLLNPLQPPAPSPARPQGVETPQRRRVEHEPPRDEAPPPEPEPEPDDEPPAAVDPEAAQLRALLERAGQADALAELARGRRVLVVLPQAAAGRGLASAVAWIAGPQSAQRFGARWWPGSAGVDVPDWLHWRVFRDGDPLLGRGLASRSGGARCRVRLGAASLQISDAASALLEIGDRIRFAQALGGQWSVLLVAAPAGTDA